MILTLTSGSSIAEAQRFQPSALAIQIAKRTFRFRQRCEWKIHVLILPAQFAAPMIGYIVDESEKCRFATQIVRTLNWKRGASTIEDPEVSVRIIRVAGGALFWFGF